MYNRYRINHLRFRFIPNLGTTEPGTFTMGFVQDPCRIIGEDMGRRAILETGKSAVSGSLWKPHSLQVDGVGGVNFLTYPSRADWRQSSPGQLIWRVDGCNEATNAEIGFIECDYSYNFFEATPDCLWKDWNDELTISITNGELTAFTPSPIATTTGTTCKCASTLGVSSWHTASLDDEHDGDPELSVGLVPIARGTRLFFKGATMLYSNTEYQLTYVDVGGYDLGALETVDGSPVRIKATDQSEVFYMQNGHYTKAGVGESSPYNS
jgi:hypothetical protein